MGGRNKDNYAFIDSQNLHLGVKSLGWTLDWRKFRIYLRDKYAVGTAYLFLGFVPEYSGLYDQLRKAGFVLKFKPTLPDGRGRIKGNVDADLVLRAMVDYEKYKKAVIVTSDGDFYSLARHLRKNQKLETVLSPNLKKCSALLKLSARKKIAFMDGLRTKLEIPKRKRTP
jgi:uncharacterized LabA/DUF88 family protein